MELFRPNVAALIVRKDGMLFIGERYDREGAWQFPQGGVGRWEGAKRALFRELEEEIGVKKKYLKILEKRRGYRYRFGKRRVKWQIYRGQVQTYYKCLFSGTDKAINIDVEHPEFRSYRWIRPEEFELEWLPVFKRKVYRDVMKDFFGVKLKAKKKKKK